MISKEEFIKNVKGIKNSRVHKVTGSVGVYDSYKYIRKHKWYNIPRPVKEGEFYKIIRLVNQYLAELLSKGVEINLPHRLGTIEIRKTPSRLSIVNGKLVTNLPIDWNATLNLWYTDEEAYNDRILVHVENEDIFKVCYNKTKADYTNKSFYEFKPNREIKKRLTKHAKEGKLEAFLKRKYD